jgi:hypothetical protein
MEKSSGLGYLLAQIFTHAQNLFKLVFETSCLSTELKINVRDLKFHQKLRIKNSKKRPFIMPTSRKDVFSAKDVFSPSRSKKKTGTEDPGCSLQVQISESFVDVHKEE